MNDNKNTQNKEKVLNEMNDYISSTMSIPVIKLDDNNDLLNKVEEERTKEAEVSEIYATTVSEEKSDLGRDMTFPTPVSHSEEEHKIEEPVKEVPKVEDPIKPVIETHREEDLEMPALDTPKVEQPSIEESANQPTMNSMNSMESNVHANLEVPKVKKKSKLPVIGGCVAVVVLLAVLGYFVIYPMIQSKFMSNPKNVFEATIKDSAKNVNAMVEKVPTSKALYDLNIKFDTNIEELAAFSGYTYGVKAGVDVDSKALEAGIYMKDANNNNYYINTYLKENKNYFKLSSYDKIIDLGDNYTESEVAEIFSGFDELMNLASTNNEDVQHLITTVADLFVDSIDEKKLSNEKATIDFNGSKIDVERNTYEIDNDNFYRTMTFILEGLEKDEISKAFIEDALGTNMSDLIKQFKDNTDRPKVDTIKINIYTAGKKKDVIGYDAVVGNDVMFYYYFDDKGFEFKLNDVELTASLEENTAETTVDLKVTGVKDGSKTNVSTKIDEQEVATLEIRQWDEKGIDLTYVIKGGVDSINGIFKVTKDNGSDFNKTNMLLTIQSGSDKISFEANVDVDYSATIADIDLNNVVVPTDEEFNAIFNNFINSLANTPVGALLSTLGGMYDDGTNAELNQYYANNPDANPFGDDYAYVMG